MVYTGCGKKNWHAPVFRPFLCLIFINLGVAYFSNYTEFIKILDGWWVRNNGSDFWGMYNSYFPIEKILLFLFNKITVVLVEYKLKLP